MGGVRSMLLGLDVSPRRLGFGLVDLVSGEPVACGCEAIELPKNGWDRERVAMALIVPAGHNRFRYGPEKHDVHFGEIQAVYIEHPISRFPGMAYDEGRAVGMVHAEVQRWWPHAPVEYLKPSEWRLLAGLKGNASKAEVMDAAVQFGADAFGKVGVSIMEVVAESQDAADALCIAVAGQRRNGETWDRAVERGETGEAA